ncbi:bile acid:sodium symporter family protein [Metabacillus dongyingensis]|uniref:bile acid:sodium symporter family protein n=1 Tax=Metabacillus dongyingensis TaxID=2874282 RepID=UPI003B8D2C65
MDRLNGHISKFLPGYISLAAIYSFVKPELFSIFNDSTSFLLALVLFFTGLSMTLKDLKGIRKLAFVMCTGLILKWTLTVLVSVILAKLFFLEFPDLAIGLILTGSVPSGTAATMYTFLAGGNTSLIVIMGIIDVFLSPVLTPSIMNFFAGSSVHVSFIDMAEKMLFIVILPIIAGMLIQNFTNRVVYKIRPYSKLISSLTIILIVLSVVANVSSQVTIQTNMIFFIACAVFIQVLLPMIGGYKIALLLGINRVNAIAILFEVGLCNSALAAILALEVFGEIAAVPAVINMIFNLSLGAYFSNYFSKRTREKKVPESNIDFSKN